MIFYGLKVGGNFFIVDFIGVKILEGFFYFTFKFQSLYIRDNRIVH